MENEGLQIGTTLPPITPEEYAKLMRRKKIALIADIILVVVLLAIGWYVYSNFEVYKALNGDVCRMCEEKTGGKCYSGAYISENPPAKVSPDYSKFNLSGILE